MKRHLRLAAFLFYLSSNLLEEEEEEKKKYYFKYPKGKISNLYYIH